MSNITETFKQPFLNKAEASVSTAVSIGVHCHKCYVALDESSHDYLNDCGYEMVLVKDKDAALRQLHDWWESSFDSRLRSVASGADIFHTVTYGDTVISSSVMSQWDNYMEHNNE